MKSMGEWTSEYNKSEIIEIADLPPIKGNHHSYNHKMIYLNLKKSTR